MMTIRRGENRGPTDLGWLSSRHTFSFGGYYDSNHMGVSALRVINDDRVIPSAGFATHSHQNMEIISYVKRGTIEHKDSMGHVERLPAGEFQLMSAGTGVTHSEYNPSNSEPLEFLQIWIEPNVYSIKPGYQQKRFDDVTGLQLIASADARDGSLLLHQNTELWQLRLIHGETAMHTVADGRVIYVHVVSGSLMINGEQLAEGDGITVRDSAEINFEATATAQALLFDLP
jgi:hypothetical protein